MLRVKSPVEGLKCGGPKICVEVSFPSFFELTEKPGCQCERFPCSALLAYSSFLLARVIVSYSWSKVF